MIRTVLRTLAFLVVIAVSPEVYAGQFEDGVTAFKRGDFQAAIHRWQPLAEEGHINASLRLGDIYLSGLGGNHDYQQAARWYRKAAERGDARAQYKLGSMYGQGKLGKRDYRQAAKWYRKAADQGLPFAQYGLSKLYEAGLGVEKNFYKAYFWKCLAEQAEGPISDKDEDTEETRRTWEQRLTAQQRAEIKNRVQAWKAPVPSGTSKDSEK